MTDAFLLGRKLLRLQGESLVIACDSPGDLSALAWAETAAGRVLWLGGDEAIGIGRDANEAEKTPTRNALLVLREHDAATFVLSDVVALREVLPQVDFVVDDDGNEGEVDIEGMDLAGDHLWLVGSHSTKRKKPKDRDRTGERLQEVRTDPNRFLLARLTVRDGAIVRPAEGEAPASAVLLPPETGGRSPLIEALALDPHLALFVMMIPTADGMAPPLPGKDNGLDIEGLAVHDGRVFLGLRGPVLRGWAVLIEIEPVDGERPGELRLGTVGRRGPRIAKHFLYLDGMGIRDLTFDGDDLLILAGPTMDVDGTSAVWRLARPHRLAEDSLTGSPPGEGAFDADRLQRLFDLPARRGTDRAEGLVRFDAADERGVMVLYDKADKERHLHVAGKKVDHAVYADLFRLPRE